MRTLRRIAALSLLAVATATTAASCGGGNTYKLTVQTPNRGGLQEGSPVKVNGKKVGTVEGFGKRYLPYAQPPVTATTVKVGLDDKIELLSQDSRTSIRGNALEITRGTGFYEYKSGDIVPLQKFRP